METTYSLKRLIEMLGKDKLSLLLRLVLSRLPILIFSDNGEADNLLNGLISLAPHRLSQIFANDFFEPDEYLQLCEDEESNFDVPRLLFCSPTDASKHIFGRIPSLKGWLLAFSQENGTSQQDIVDKIKAIEDKFLIIILEKNELKLTLHGMKYNDFDLTWEKRLISDISQKTEIALEKMKRVIKKRIKAPPSNEVMAAIMRFDSEEDKIRTSIFNAALNEFSNAATRALAILSRIDLLKELGFDIELSSKLLLQTIDYEEMDADRILELIEAEYGISFYAIIRGGKAVQVLDRIDGFWG